MQSFVLQVDKETGTIHFQDVAEKQQIVTMVHFVKIDVTEARILTGTDDLEAAAAILEVWGSRETVISSSEGVLVRSNGKSYFQKFSNRGVEGRTGRGDTLMGAYLARRMEYPIEESLKFATALTSIKIETNGPFRGTVEDVLEREKWGGH
jgi:sugar/nucleoside kinase (ribokinase family)